MNYGGLTVGYVTSGKDTIAGSHTIGDVARNQELALVVLEP